MQLSPTLLCEIHAPRAAQATALAEIVVACAQDVNQPLLVKTLALGSRSPAPVLTLHLPAELASRQHQVWCLACFCPQARISVLVTGASFARQDHVCPSAHRRRSA